MGGGSGSGGAGADEGAAAKLGSAAADDAGGSGPSQLPAAAKPAEPTLAVITTTHPTGDSGRPKGAEGGGGPAVTREVVKRKPKKETWTDRIRNKLAPPKRAAGADEKVRVGGADEEADDNFYSVSGDEGTEWKELPLFYRTSAMCTAIVAFALYANTRPDIRVFGFGVAIFVLVVCWRGLPPALDNDKLPVKPAIVNYIPAAINEVRFSCCFPHHFLGVYT